MEKNNRGGIFQKIAGVFIFNKELGVLTILLLVSFGIFGFVMMPKQYNPEIVAPAFRVNVAFPNATAEEVYELVTRPMENKLGEISEVDDIYSQSSPGFSSVLVTFDIGSNEQDAKIDLVQRLRSNMGEKPLGAQDPAIEDIDVNDVPIITFAITSEQFSPEALRSFALDLSDRLKHIPDTAKITVRGGRRTDLSVFVDVDKMQAFNVSVGDLQRAIVANNVNSLVTEVDDDPYNISVRAYGSIENIEQLKKIIIFKNDDVVVRVEDVASVEVGEIGISNYVRFDDQEGTAEAVFLGVAKKSGTNATTVAREVHKEISKISEQKFIPSHVSVETVSDDGAVAEESINGLTKSLFQSVTIVIFVLLIFLSTRSALVVAVAIPLSLLSVFGFGLLFDQTINRITLFALILSLGLLVDSATVVVENMYRSIKLRRNEKKEDVIIDAVAEVGGGLVMSTITTVLAFIPMAFVTGMMGPYMGPIPFFVPMAVIASLFIALTISPFLGSVILRVEDRGNGIISKIQKKVNTYVVRIENVYVDFLQKVFKSKKRERVIIWGVIVLLLASLSLPLFTAVKFRMLPKSDRNQFYVYVDADSGTNIEQTNRVAKKMTNEILSLENVESVQSTVGTPPIIDFNGLFKGSDGRKLPSQATLKVNLTSKDERKEMSEDIAMRTRESLLFLASQESVHIKIIEDPPGPPVLATYHLKVQGDDRADYPVLQDIAKELERKSASISGVVDVDVSRNEQGIEKTYRVNTEEATLLGVSVEEIFSTMEILSGGMNVSLYHDTLTNNQKFSEQHYISLRSEKEDRTSLDDINKVSVRSERGSLVALSELLDEASVPVDDTIVIDSQYPTVYVSGEMKNRSVVYASIDMLKYLVGEYRLPSGQGKVDSWNLFGVNYVDSDGTRYNVRIGGEWELTLEVFRDFGASFAVAIFLIYFVLVAQFKSLKVPVYIMATIPLSLIGVLPGFMILFLLKGIYFNATSMIGVIALSGIVVNNAIIYLEYVFQDQKKGSDLETSLIEAGRTRLLPIALTSLTTILGSLTIISDPVWEGLAWAIVTGLSLSAFLTLIVLPIIYRKYETKKYE